LQIPRKYLTEGKIKREIEVEMPGQPFSPNKLNKGDNSQKYSEAKKAQQKPQQDNNPPKGT
jgi:hypothetical protein